MTAAQRKAAPAGDVIEITRVFDAPRAPVFSMWTDPKHMMRWWAPHGCTTPHCTMDVRVGGRFHFCIRGPDGKDGWGLGIYLEVVPPERIVYRDSFADPQGNPVPPSHYGMSAAVPAETIVRVTFTEEGKRTRVTLRHEFPGNVPERDGTAKGWSEMLERLDEALA